MDWASFQSVINPSIQVPSTSPSARPSVPFLLPLTDFYSISLPPIHLFLPYPFLSVAFPNQREILFVIISFPTHRISTWSSGRQWLLYCHDTTGQPMIIQYFVVHINDWWRSSNYVYSDPFSVLISLAVSWYRHTHPSSWRDRWYLSTRQRTCLFPRSTGLEGWVDEAESATHKLL